MPKLVIAMAAILVAWAALSVVFTGVGLLVLRLVRVRPANSILVMTDLFTSFWIGWCATLAFLQLWHFVLPVNAGAFAGITAAGLIGAAVNARDLRAAIVAYFSEQRWLRAGLCLAAAGITAFVSDYALAPNTVWDTGLYHLDNLRWFSTYPIVPGLGNLHARLAFNSSSLLYCAMFEFGPLYERAWWVSHGLLLAVLFWQALLHAPAILARAADPGRRAHAALLFAMLPSMLVRVLEGHPSAVTPDLPVFVLGIVSAGLLVELALRAPSEDVVPSPLAGEGGHERSECRVRGAVIGGASPLPAFASRTSALSLKGRGGDRDDFLFFAVSFISVVGVSVKLSYAVLGLTNALLALILWARRRWAANKRLLLSVACLGAIVLGAWMARSVILTGYPAYPSSAFAFPVEWRVPQESVRVVKGWLYGWAKIPGVHFSQTEGNWNWFGPWLDQLLANRWEFRVPVALAAIGLAALVFNALWRRGKTEPRLAHLALLLPPFCSIVFWFFTAPMIRYGGASFWILGATALAAALCSFGRSRLAMFFAVLIVAGTLYQCYEPGRAMVRGRRTFSNGIYGYPKVSMSEYTTKSGLKLYFPAEEWRQYYARLPNTPYPHPLLALRKPGDLSAGFKVDPFNDAEVIGITHSLNTPAHIVDVELPAREREK